MDPRLAELRHLLPLRPPRVVAVPTATPHDPPVDVEPTADAAVQCCAVDALSDRADTMALLLLGEAPLETLDRALAPGGSVAVCTRSARRWRRALRARGYTVERYAALPGIHDPRVIAPSGPRPAAAALGLYQPSRARARLAKRAAFAASRAGMQRLLSRDAILVAVKPGVAEAPRGLRQTLAAHLAQPLAVALFPGTPGALRKPSLLLMTPKGVVVGYAKLATPHTAALLQCEVDALSGLQGVDLGAAEVPRVLADVRVGQTDRAVVQSTTKRALDGGPLRADGRHVEFLAHLAAATRGPARWRGGAFEAELEERLTRIPPHHSGQWLAPLQAALRFGIEQLDAHGVASGMAHRDFTPWNTYTRRGRLCVFDWEFARQGWPPLGDALHFALQTGVLVDRLAPTGLASRLLDARAGETDLAARVAIELGIAPALRRAALALYLCDIASLYLTQHWRAGPIDRDGHALAATWSTLLNCTLHARGSS